MSQWLSSCGAMIIIHTYIHTCTCTNKHTSPKEPPPSRFSKVSSVDAIMRWSPDDDMLLPKEELALTGEAIGLAPSPLPRAPPTKEKKKQKISYEYA